MLHVPVILAVVTQQLGARTHRRRRVRTQPRLVVVLVFFKLEFDILIADRSAVVDEACLIAEALRVNIQVEHPSCRVPLYTADIVRVVAVVVVVLL